MLEGVDHKINGIVQRHHEARHVRVRDRDGFTLHHLLHPQRNHRTPARHHVAVARTADRRRCALAQFAALGDGDLLHQRLRDAHGIDRIGSLVRRENHDVLHSVFDGRFEYIARADYVRARSLHREELARRNLFQGRRCENIVDPAHRDINGRFVAYVADIELHFRVLQRMTHVILLFFIPAENADLLDVAIQKATQYCIAKTPPCRL